MLFYVQYPDKHVEIWNHNKWYYNFVFPGTECAEPFSFWNYAPLDGSNHTTTYRDLLKSIYYNQPKQISFFDEVENV